MFRSESTTPYTSFASSSNERLDVGGGGWGAMGLYACWAGPGVVGPSSFTFTATTMPDEEASVLRLLWDASGWAVGYTGAYTAGSMPPSTANFGRTVRCQSW